MFPLIAVGVSEVSRGETASGAARMYAATRTNVETVPLTAVEPSARGRGRRPGERRNRRSPLEDPQTGTNVDIEV